MKIFKNSILLSTLVIFLFSASANAQDKKDIDTLSFKVEGVCGMCKERIEEAAYGKGVKLVNWDKDSRMITVIYKTSKTSEETIHAHINAAGHDTSNSKSSDTDYGKLPGCCAYRDGVKTH